VGRIVTAGIAGKGGSSALLGILGGTFDPPHLGHLILAETACDALDLTRVLFVPAADPPHKRDLVLTPIEHRVAMLKSAIEGNPRFAISDVDMARSGPHYTVDTLRILKEQNPDSELYFILGGDALHDLVDWRYPGGIIAQARLAAMGRPGAKVDLASLEAKLPGISHQVVFVDAPSIGISATLIRDNLHQSRSIRYLVPDPVEKYIMEHKLYANHA
jgi:nicotinate-nucleotide adenylyltransferase